MVSVLYKPSQKYESGELVSCLTKRSISMIISHGLFAASMVEILRFAQNDIHAIQVFLRWLVVTTRKRLLNGHFFEKGERKFL